MKALRAHLVLDCTPDEFAAACGPDCGTVDVAVVDVRARDEHAGRLLLMAGLRQRTHDEYQVEGDAGAPLRLFLGPRREVSDG
jgi:hypothetical protein